jgi:5-methylcytosine-specific restriction protein A
VTNPRWPPGWERTRRTVLARDRHTCQIQLPGCAGVATHVDHIEPRRWGGGDDLANLRAACAPCNQRRSDGSSLPAPAPASVW